uniref:energy transducer TonB n=1 Tax=Parerythrobacter lutipelagi TaxID=1964208 RepID=UPI001375FD16|nr:energy transducer TonB [Parerythrobacter lutipelagi]
MLKTNTIAALAATSVLAAFAPAAFAQTGNADDAYYQSGPWTVLDRANIFCAIENRDLGEGRLTLSRSATEPANFSFYGSERKDYNTPSTGIVWLFDGEPVAGSILAGHIYQVREPNARVEALFSKALRLTITHNDETVAEIDLKGSAAAFRKLEECSAQYPGSRVPMIPPPAPPLYRPPAPQPVTIPEPNLEGPFEPNQSLKPLSPGRWIGYNDYRGTFLRNEMEGTVGITLTVTPSGRVAHCQITKSSGYAEMDAHTCDLVTRRARFQPGTDGDANRISGLFSTNVVWRIPN